ncbi:murein biosynthesis integral membrane protein MurJ [Citricoccus parietis]|uniref:Murein biosynthesis integral membrane protein MurJ n=2 Tax=Citricoccus parietis TaxID=592307 RepID=A0ABV6F6I8_9MICC
MKNTPTTTPDTPDRGDSPGPRRPGTVPQRRTGSTVRPPAPVPAPDPAPVSASDPGSASASVTASAAASSEADSTAKSSAIMAAGTLVSRILGFVRTALLTVAIGSTAMAADIFESANTIPNIIYMLLAGGVFNVVLVPQLIKAAKKPDKGSDYTSRLITLAVLVMAAATLVITLAAAPIMVALTSNWSPAMLTLGTAFALWTFPQIFFYGVYAVLGQVLNANGRFGAYMWAPVANNVVAIGVIGLYLAMFGSYQAGGDQLAEWTTGQTVLLAGGHTLGIVVQALVLFVPLSRLGLGLKPKFGWKGMGLRSTGKLAGYTLVTMMAGNVVNLLVARLVSGATEARASLGEASGSGGPFEGLDPAVVEASIPGLMALNIAQLITVLPHSVFVLSLATVLFNQLARSLHRDDVPGALATISRGLRNFAVPMMFSTVVVLVLAGPLGRVFAGSSETAAASAVAIGQLLILLALGMPFRSAHIYLMRMFYAAENARIPMLVQVGTAACTLVIAYVASIFMPSWAMAYLMVSVFTLLHVAQFVAAHVLVRRHYGDYGAGEVLDAYLRTGVAAVVSGVAGALVLWLIGGYSGGFPWSTIITALVSCAVVGLVMIVVYFVMLRAMRLPELTEFLGPLARKIPGLTR